MAVTMKQVRAVLDPEEPNYAAGAALGPEALPHLEALVDSGEPMLASKATYLASLIQHERAADVVQKAAQSQDPVIRVAAAAAAANLGEAANSDVLRTLAADRDHGVRKVARAKLGGEASQGGDLADSPDDRQADRIVFGLMPGEEAARMGASPMPESTSDRMPGEPAGGGTGLMPGERPGGATRTDGEMPR